MSDVIYLDHFRPGSPVVRVRKALERMPEEKRSEFADRAEAFAGTARRSPRGVTVADRETRLAVWRKVAAELEYWAALRALSDAALTAAIHDVLPAPSAPHLVGAAVADAADDIISKHRAAMAKLLLTPAPFSSCVIKKNGLLRSVHFQFLGLTEEQVEAQIAADEAFLEACPRRQRGRTGEH